MRRSLCFGLMLACSLALSAQAQNAACTCQSKPGSDGPEHRLEDPKTPVDKGSGKKPSRTSAPPSTIEVRNSYGLPCAAGGGSDNEKEAPAGCPATLIQAEAAAKAWDLDSAADKYAEALKLCKGDDAKHAESEFRRLYKLKNSWWYKAGESFPPIRWAFIYPFWFILGVILLVLLILSLSPRFFSQGGVLFWSRHALQWLFMPPYVGHAVIITPADLGEKTQVALFATALQSNARLARELLSGDRDHLQVRSTNLLTIPSELAANTFKDLPEVKGINLGGVFQLLLNMGRYFGWRVETQLAYFPAPKSAPGQPSPSARMLAIATLRWAWFADTPVRVIRNVRDAQDVEDLAFAVAARILGRYFVVQEPHPEEL